MKIYYFAAMAIVLALGGCTSPRISKNLTSGQIGCLPDEIMITNEAAGIEGTHSWMATCRGKEYICNYHSTTGSRCTLRQQEFPGAIASSAEGVSSTVKAAPTPWYQTPVRD